jgi:hypothetical protein
MKKLLVLVLLATLALSGCSGARSEAASAGGVVVGSDYSVPDVAPMPAQPGDDKTAQASGDSPDLSPQIVRTAQVALRVPQLLPAVARLRLLAASHDGQVTSEQLSLSEGGSATSSFVVLEVAAAQLDDALAAIGDLGEVLSRRVSADDVTTQVADIDARLRNLDASIERLTKLMGKAGSLADLTALEEQLTARQGERDSLAAQQKALAGQVARSTITVSLETPGAVVTTTAPGFLGGLQAGLDGLAKTLAVTATLIGMVLPFAAILGIVLLPLLWWRHRRRQRRVGGDGPDLAQESSEAPDGLASDSAETEQGSQESGESAP